MRSIGAGSLLPVAAQGSLTLGLAGPRPPSRRLPVPCRPGDPPPPRPPLFLARAGFGEDQVAALQRGREASMLVRLQEHPLRRSAFLKGDVPPLIPVRKCFAYLLLQFPRSIGE